MAKRSTNSRHAGGISTTNPSDATWAVMDGLPQQMRRALHELPVAVNPASARDLIEYGGCVLSAVAMLQDACADELRQFSSEHRARHGYALPHVAARASWQPYEPRRSSTRRPRHLR